MIHPQGVINNGDVRYMKVIRSYIFNRSWRVYPSLSQFRALGSNYIEKVRRYIGKAPDGDFFINASLSLK